MLPQEILPGVSATTITGLLSSRDNQHILKPHPPQQYQPLHIKLLWGELSVEAVIQALREVGVYICVDILCSFILKILFFSMVLWML